MDLSNRGVQMSIKFESKKNKNTWKCRHPKKQQNGALQVLLAIENGRRERGEKLTRLLKSIGFYNINSTCSPKWRLFGNMEMFSLYCKNHCIWAIGVSNGLLQNSLFPDFPDPGGHDGPKTPPKGGPSPPTLDFVCFFIDLGWIFHRCLFHLGLIFLRFWGI